MKTWPKIDNEICPYCNYQKMTVIYNGLLANACPYFCLNYKSGTNFKK